MTPIIDQDRKNGSMTFVPWSTQFGSQDHDEIRPPGHNKETGEALEDCRYRSSLEKLPVCVTSYCWRRLSVAAVGAWLDGLSLNHSEEDALARSQEECEQ